MAYEIIIYTVAASVVTVFPDDIRSDRETSFISTEFSENWKDKGINKQFSVIVEHNQIGNGETYHYPLTIILEVVKKDYRFLPDKIILRMALKSINYIMGPNRLVPSLLVYGFLPTFPWPSNNHLKQKERFEQMKIEGEEMETVVHESKINRAVQAKLLSATKYLILRGKLLGVSRERSGRWENPFYSS